MKFIFLFLSLLVSTFSHAEVFMGITPYMTLGEAKKLFPNAQFAQKKPAWLPPDSVFLQIVGAGLPGTIYVYFEDIRPLVKQMVKEKGGVYANILSDDEGFKAAWVRLVPNQNFSIEKLIAKYGPPEKKYISSDGFFAQKAEWPKFGIDVTLSEDERLVREMVFSFSKEDLIDYYKARGEAIPKRLLDEN